MEILWKVAVIWIGFWLIDIMLTVRKTLWAIHERLGTMGEIFHQISEDKKIQ